MSSYEKTNEVINEEYTLEQKFKQVCAINTVSMTWESDKMIKRPCNHFFQCMFMDE